VNIPVQINFNQVCSSGEIHFINFLIGSDVKKKFCAGGHLVLLIDQYKVNQTWWSSYIADQTNIKLTRLGGHLTLLIDQYRVNQTYFTICTSTLFAE